MALAEKKRELKIANCKLQIESSTAHSFLSFRFAIFNLQFAICIFPPVATYGDTNASDVQRESAHLSRL